MKKLGFFSILSRSLYDFAFYREVVAMRFGSVFWYYFRFIALCVAIITFIVSFRVRSGLREMEQWVNEKLPEFTLRNGKFSINVKQPYVMEDPDGRNIFIIDTTGKTTALPSDNREGLLITKTKAFLRRHRGFSMEEQTINFADFKEWDINRTTVIGWTQTLTRFWILLMIPVYMMFLMYHFIVRLIEAFIFALIGLVIASIARIELSHTINISLVALTAPLALDVIAGALGFGGGWMYLVYYGIYLVYLTTAILSCRGVKRET
jgi:Flp pilus assembly protein TadB